MKNSKKPVYPVTEKHRLRGLDKREHISIEILKALVSNPDDSWVEPKEVLKALGIDDLEKYDLRLRQKYFCKIAVEYADDLLEELEKNEGE